MKKITSLLLMLFVFIGLQAQTAKVQGVPRQFTKSAKAERAAVYPNIDFDDIVYQVGNGTNLSALVIKWDDGKGGNCNLVWGYRWTTPTEGTGEAMLRAIAKADPRFYMLTYGNTQYGATIGGMGFDLNGNGNIALIKSDTSYPLTNGIYNSSAYDFDSYTSNDATDHWRSGWTNGYWSYWTASNISKTYEYSNIGASSRQLANRSIDGWSFISDMNNWYSNDMSGEVCYVSVPATTANTAFSKKMLPQTRSRVLDGIVTVQTIEDFYKCINEAMDGDTVQFEPNLRGTIITDNTSTASFTIKEKNITLIGNGVIIEGGYGLFLANVDKATISDFTFRNLQNNARAIFAQESNITIEKCIFEGVNGGDDGAAVMLECLNRKDCTINLYNCRFSNNKTTGRGALCAYTDATINSERKYNLFANIVSCTFEGNKSGDRGNSFVAVNYPIVKIANCVFENDDTANGLPTIGISRGKKLTADYFKMAYNIIEGTVSTPEDDVKRLSDTDICQTTIADNILDLANGEYQVVKNGLAYNRFPANTTVEGITMPERDILGLEIDYTKATHTGACQQVFSTNTNVDYTKGTFIVNEDWFGHQNSTVNFLTNQGEWIYKVFQKENPGMELGTTTQYGAIYGDKFFIVSKQAKDPGASVTGGRFTVCDSKTLKCIKQFENIATKEDGSSKADGRAFLGVDEHKGYISTNNGIYIYNIDTKEMEGQVKGSGNPNDDPYGSLYYGQVGTMLRVNDKVFAVHQSAGVLVIDANADTLTRVIQAPTETVNGKETLRGFGSIVLSKDGNLWISVAANQTGSGATAPYIYKMNPNTCDTTRINMPEGIYPPANSWYAWTADGFCASKQNNCLYWNGGNSSWFSGKQIFKYDIDKNEFKSIINLADSDWKLYGACFRVDPVTDELYASLYHDFSDPTHVLFKYDNEGKELTQYSMINNYWFPAMPVFPDNEAPVITTVSPATHDSQDPFVISLAGITTDADNMEAAIVKSVSDVSDRDVLLAAISNGDLRITPQGKKGQADVTVKVNSNGKLAETIVSVEITQEGSDIDEKLVVRSAYSNGQCLFIGNCEGFDFTLFSNNGQVVNTFRADHSSFSAAANVPLGIYYLKGSNGKERVTFKLIFK